MNTLPISLGGRSYDILLEAGLLDSIGRWVAPLGINKCLLLSDDHVAPLYAGRVLASLRDSGLKPTLVTLPAGEGTKRLDCLGQVYRAMADAELSRSDALVALGGGVIGDLGGFAAATYLRGIRLIQVPTTLLAQVDSAVGGKTAIDLDEGKNLVGSFYQPHRVLIDPDTLNTLPPREMAGGMGEVIKYAATFDQSLWPLLEDAGAHLDQIVPRCLELKRRVVERDEMDLGERMLLNFGHTLGHAIEKAQGYRGYIHGEAVAAGMCLMTRLTEARGVTLPGTAAQLEAMCRAWRLPITADKALWPAMAPALSQDKKHLRGTLTIVALESLGKGRLLPCPTGMLEEVVAWLR